VHSCCLFRIRPGSPRPLRKFRSECQTPPTLTDHQHPACLTTGAGGTAIAPPTALLRRATGAPATRETSSAPGPSTRITHGQPGMRSLVGGREVEAQNSAQQSGDRAEQDREGLHLAGVVAVPQPTDAAHKN
jgi:hypothetical protein